MKTTLEFIAELKLKTGLESDYAIAKLLGVTKVTLSHYQNGKTFLGDQTAMKVAELLEVNPAYVVACIHAERAKFTNEKNTRNNFAPEDHEDAAMHTDDDLLLWGSPKVLAQLLGVTLRTAQLYKSGKVIMPEPQRRLLRLRVAGDLSALLGSAWEGFQFDAKGRLFVPGWSNGMQPEKIKAAFFIYQEAAALRAEVRKLKTELWALRKMLDLHRGGAVRHEAAPLQYTRHRPRLQIGRDGDHPDQA